MEFSQFMWSNFCQELQIFNFTSDRSFFEYFLCFKIELTIKKAKSSEKYLESVYFNLFYRLQ